MGSPYPWPSFFSSAWILATPICNIMDRSPLFLSVLPPFFCTFDSDGYQLLFDVPLLP